MGEDQEGVEEEMKIRKGQEENFKKWVEINDDPYSKAVVDYAIRWADLMEADMQLSSDFKGIAEETSFKADTEGITGFMQGAAVHGLSQFWEYGDILRSWHNGKYNYHGDGVVNPAIITLGV